MLKFHKAVVMTTFVIAGFFSLGPACAKHAEHPGADRAAKYHRLRLRDAALGDAAVKRAAKEMAEAA